MNCVLNCWQSSIEQSPSHCTIFRCVINSKGNLYLTGQRIMRISFIYELYGICMNLKINYSGHCGRARNIKFSANKIIKA